MRSVLKREYQVNPLYGYSIDSIKATKPNTIVYRIKSEVYNRFLAPTVFRNWGEAKLKQVFPKEIRMEGSTKKVQEQMLKQFVIREFDPSHVLLKHG